ncbi:hypothetical protein ABTZ59_01420 [Streptomyces sp. NPDC094034]|uniref:hypothetical protein n=1 Tax=Streptomyces sp. NPDC094034 TaxID=3155309 RepID=UPI00332E9750
MSRRGRKAALPEAGHQRPTVLDTSGLVVRHRSKLGTVKEFDFAELSFAPAMRRSLAALFAAKCAPGGGWDSHDTSVHIWRLLRGFGEYLTETDQQPDDMAGLTAATWMAWRLSRPQTQMGYVQITSVAGFLQLDPRLAQPVRAAMAKRVPRVKVEEHAFAPDEFEEVRRSARQMFRSALLRIRENVQLLESWRSGAIEHQDLQKWLIGEGLDCLARTGHIPRYKRSDNRMRPVFRYSKAMGGDGAIYTWRRLYLSRREATALGVLLAAEHGLNATTVGEMRTPRATPDSGEGRFPVYRMELEKRRKGEADHFETRNLADFGADSPGRLITEALEATAPARAYLASVGCTADRFLIWHETRPRQWQDTNEALIREGPFGLGLTKPDFDDYGTHFGPDGGGVMRRTRKTANVVHRREPGQNSQDTHDSVYVIPEPQAQQAAIPVIAAGAEDALESARRTVFTAKLTDAPEDGEVEAATNGCADYENSPITGPGASCGASFLLCTACPNARVHPAHHARLAHLHRAIGELEDVLPRAVWDAEWSEPHARLSDLKRRLGPALWRRALANVTAEDREVVGDLLNGLYDL